MKNLFIPKSEDIDSSFNKIKEVIAKLQIDYDLGSMVTGEKAIEDISCTLYGQKVTILKADIIIKGIGGFKAIIRGFICFLLIMFNINQFLALIGQAPISIAGGRSAHDGKGAKSKGANDD